jgi:replicative DNA helicase
MSDVQYGTRVLARTAEIRNHALRNGSFSDDEWEQITEAMMLHGSLPVEFMFSTRYIEDLRMEVQKKVDGDGLDLLVVDYMQLMQSKQRFRQDFERIAYVSKTLKDMTIDLNIAIIALAQVGRAAQGDMPTLAELRGSGDIEQDADNIIFMHKPEPGDQYIHPEDRDKLAGWEMMQMRYIALNLAKQRQGDIGTVHLIFNPAKMTFTEPARY